MRLLNVRTYQLEEFFESSRPEYAILSHTWGENETTYQDLRDGRKEGKGWDKIEAFCQKSKRAGYKYGWVDTCCIDKSSSAELSEAINSMYQWYKDSEICYVYMSDVPPNNNHFDESSAFRRSRWFQRGWTLQEFLAPDAIIFFDDSWHYCFELILSRPRGIPENHAHESLVTLLSEITGVNEYVVRTGDFESTIIAQRLSWASHRVTTRIEDMAYSLLGILDINMPLLYGEGKAAFQRLQEEVLKTKLDQSYLSWGLNMTWDQMPDGDLHLAESPAFFQNCQNLGRSWIFDDGLTEMRFQSVTNQGLLIELPIMEINKRHNVVLALLQYGPVKHRDYGSNFCTAIPLFHFPGHSYFRRLDGSTPFFAPYKLLRRARNRQICLLNYKNMTFGLETPQPIISKAKWIPSRWIHGHIWITVTRLLGTGYRMTAYYPSHDTPRTSTITTLGLPYGIDCFFLEFTNGRSRVGACFHGTLRSQSDLRMRFFRIHRGSALKIALSIQRSWNLHGGKKKWFDKELEVEELCNDSACPDTSHPHLIYETRVTSMGTDIYLKQILDDGTS
ncbi:hypothetical protein PFICI_00223 [Pestalotiopsis fici W106-1]|uniref:Heterokaryon incompatibility domain-containing protein n=1 Tax=Pestalotiopsis fici (strain W106-1 / CGMCC3.15140) TaxID=1229662 RepID=W3XK69_PESFW|nr:uncharacterized protein PFICI_00223 [Pestalotiopsis fici W106-1]ETS86395.1 hypothetical protein PFICI_00223 [Pestalotiopsis fici W106-1]